MTRLYTAFPLHAPAASAFMTRRPNARVTVVLPDPMAVLRSAAVLGDTGEAVAGVPPDTPSMSAPERTPRRAAEDLLQREPRAAADRGGRGDRARRAVARRGARGRGEPGVVADLDLGVSATGAGGGGEERRAPRA